jgi:hypothetical protein
MYFRVLLFLIAGLVFPRAAFGQAQSNPCVSEYECTGVSAPTVTSTAGGPYNVTAGDSVTVSFGYGTEPGTKTMSDTECDGEDQVSEVSGSLSESSKSVTITIPADTTQTQMTVNAPSVSGTYEGCDGPESFGGSGDAQATINICIPKWECDSIVKAPLIVAYAPGDVHAKPGDTVEVTFTYEIVAGTKRLRDVNCNKGTKDVPLDGSITNGYSFTASVYINPAPAGTRVPVSSASRSGQYTGCNGTVTFSGGSGATAYIVVDAPNCHEQKERELRATSSTEDVLGEADVPIAWCNDGTVRRVKDVMYRYRVNEWYERTIYSGAVGCPSDTAWAATGDYERGEYLSKYSTNYRTVATCSSSGGGGDSEAGSCDGPSAPNHGEAFVTGDIPTGDPTETVWMKALPPAVPAGEPPPQFLVQVGHRIVTNNTPRTRDLEGELRLSLPPGQTLGDAYTIEVAARDENGEFIYNGDEQAFVPYTPGNGVSVVERGHSGCGVHSHHQGAEVFRFTMHKRESLVLLATVDPAGEAEGDGSPLKRVRMILGPLALAIDSDNNDGFDLPADDLAERVVVGKQLSGLPPEVLVRYPGKILMVSDGDVDGDLVPDLADGLDIFQTDGIRSTTGLPESTSFVPFVLNLATFPTPADVRLRFTYPASDPALIQKSPDGRYQPAPGSLRLWRKDGSALRKVAGVQAAGDYIQPGIDYTLVQLGRLNPTEPLVLYVEAIKPSTAVADLQIKVETGLSVAGVAVFPVSTEVRVTTLNLALMQVSENDAVTSPRVIESSQPAPEVSVSNMSVYSLRANSEATGIVGSLSFTGKIACPISDITPGDKGAIRNLYLYMNDEDEPAAVIPVSVSKSVDEASFIRPYPYAGTFSTSVSGIRMREGANVVRLVAHDPLNNTEGFTEYSFHVDAISASSWADGPTTTLSLKPHATLPKPYFFSAPPPPLAPPPAPTVATTVVATLYDSGRGLVVHTLTETGVKTNVFKSVETGAMTITVSPSSIGSSIWLDYQLGCRVDVAAWEMTNLFLNLFATTPTYPKSEFHGGLYSSDSPAADYQNVIFAYSQPAFVSASGKSTFHPYMLQVQGPEAFLAQVQSIAMDDGPRMVEKSPIDDHYYVKMKNSKPVVTYFTNRRIVAGEPPHEENIDAMEAAVAVRDYSIGFVYGFGASGWSAAEGIWNLMRFAAKANNRYTPAGLLWAMTWGDQFETEKHYIKLGKETANAIAPVVMRINDDHFDFYISLLSGDLETVGDITLPYLLALQYSGDLLIELAKDFDNKPAYEKGYYAGYATFEIASLAVEWTKAGKLTEFGKLDFLTELRLRPFFSGSGPGAAAFARLQGLLTDEEFKARGHLFYE